MKTKSGNVPTALAAALLLAAALCGCVTMQTESPAVKSGEAVQAPGYAGGSSSFSDEQYIWQDWLYGTNKSDKAWR